MKESLLELSADEALQQVDLLPWPSEKNLYTVPGHFLRVVEDSDSLEVTNRENKSASTVEVFEMVYKGRSYRFSALQGRLIVEMITQVHQLFEE